MAMEQLVEDLLTFTRLLRPGRRPDMTPEQSWLLRHLRRSGSVSIGELANALNITTGSATVACQRLEKAGLVSRERKSSDERVVQVTLTEQGRTLIDEWRKQKREALTSLLVVLDKHDQQTLQSLIERLLSAAEAQDFGGREGK